MPRIGKCHRKQRRIENYHILEERTGCRPSFMRDCMKHSRRRTKAWISTARSLLYSARVERTRPRMQERITLSPREFLAQESVGCKTLGPYPDWDKCFPLIGACGLAYAAQPS